MDVQHIRAESDAWMALTETVREIEARKRDFPPSSREFLALAKQVEDLTRIIFDISQRQFGASAVAVARDAEQPALNEVEAMRPVPEIIEEWREAERRLSIAPPDSPDFIAALDEAERLRAEYKETSRRRDGSA